MMSLNLNKILPASIGPLLLLHLTSITASAQIRNPAIGRLGSEVEEARSGSLFTEYFILLWRAAITIGAILVIVYFVWGAIEWITAGGDSGKIEKARQRIFNAILGLILLVASFAIVGFVGALLFGDDFSLLRLTMPTADI
jgi:amino acid transporter